MEHQHRKRKRFFSVIILLATAAGILAWIAMERDSFDGVSVSPTLRIYPIADLYYPSFYVVNQGRETLTLSGDIRVQEEVNGAWRDYFFYEAPEGTVEIAPNNIYFFYFSTAWRNYDRWPGHFRASIYNAVTREAYTGEFWLTDDWDWDVLPLTEILAPSPFTHITETGESLGISIQVEAVTSAAYPGMVDISYTVGNTSQYLLEMGPGYYTEVCLAGDWYVTPFAGYTLTLTQVRPGETRRFSGQLQGGWTLFSPMPGLQFTWPDVTYRLIKPVTVVYDENPQPGRPEIYEEVLLSKTFTVS